MEAKHSEQWVVVRGKVRVSGVYTSKLRARRRVDKLDNAHGSYAHSVVCAACGMGFHTAFGCTAEPGLFVAV